MGFFFKNKKKNKEEETVTPVVETTPEVPAKEGMILVREGIKLGLHTLTNFTKTNDPYVTPIPDKRLKTMMPVKLLEKIDMEE